MRKVLILIAAVLIGGAVFTACGTEGKQAIFSGRVTETDTSIYLAGVRVFEKSHANLSTVTDSAGYFKLDGVYFEEHNIYFEKEEYNQVVFNFEYTGGLDHPLISEHIVMEKADEGE